MPKTRPRGAGLEESLCGVVLAIEGGPRYTCVNYQRDHREIKRA